MATGHTAGGTTMTSQLQTRRQFFIKLGESGIVVLGVGSIPAILAACSSAPAGTATPSAAGGASPGATAAGKATGTVDFWGWPGGIDGPQGIAPDFAAVNPNLKINFITIGGEEEIQKFKTALITGTGLPDVGGSFESLTEQFTATADKLVDLTDRMKPYVDLIVPGSLQVATTDDGRIVGIPHDATPSALYYRADLFEKYGIKLEDVATWDSYLKVAKDVTASTNGKVKMLFLNRDDPNLWMQRFIHSQLGSGFFSLDGSTVTMDDEANVTALTIIKQLWDADIAWKDVGWDAQWAYMEQDTLVSLPHNVWMQQILATTPKDQTGKWRIEKLPAVTPGGNRNSRNSGATYMIPKQAKNPDGAWEFLSWALLIPENQLRMFKKNFLFPSNKATYDLPDFDTPVDFLGGQKANSLWADIYLNAPPYRFTPHYSVALNVGNAVIPRVLDGELSPADGLKQAADEVRRQTGLK